MSLFFTRPVPTVDADALERFLRVRVARRDPAVYEQLNTIIGRRRNTFRRVAKGEFELDDDRQRDLQTIGQWLRSVRDQNITVSHGFKKAVAAARASVNGGEDIIGFGDGPVSEVTCILTRGLNEKTQIQMREAHDGYYFYMRDHLTALHTSWSQVTKSGRLDTVNFSGWSYQSGSEQGKGHMRILLANRIALAQAMGGSVMLGGFGYPVGCYAFARAGFLPGQQSWNDVRNRIGSSLKNKDYPVQVKSDILHTLQNDDPHAMWDLVDLPHRKDDGKSYIHEIMAKSGCIWHGSLSLLPGEQLDRARNYIGHTEFDAAQECAKLNPLPARMVTRQPVRAESARHSPQFV